jgi:hypothetical protein
MVIVLMAAAASAAEDALTKMRAKYASEDNPVKKAKILAKLGSREITAVRNLAKADEDDKALATLEQYRDEVHDTTRALAAAGVDAARHSSGFKELQISLRTSLRRLDDIILSLQQEIRPAFRAARRDLETDQNYLIDALFPVKNPHGATSARSR